MKKLLACLAVSTILLAGCTFGTKSEGVVKVNDSIITKGQFNSEFDKTLDNSMFKAMGGSFSKTKS